LGGPPARSGLTELRDGMVRKVLVTGATGRIGSQLVPRLAGYNDLALRAFVRNTKNAAPLASRVRCIRPRGSAAGARRGFSGQPAFWGQGSGHLCSVSDRFRAT
jgi:NAD(P)-dependent dehydrogenase (short-subunit alcohol dehydrogenase family)